MWEYIQIGTSHWLCLGLGALLGFIVAMFFHGADHTEYVLREPRNLRAVRRAQR